MHIGFLDLQETFPLNTKLDFDLLSLTLDIQLAFVYPSRIVRNLEYCNSSIYSTLNNQEPHQWKAISDTSYTFIFTLCNNPSIPSVILYKFDTHINFFMLKRFNLFTTFSI